MAFIEKINDADIKKVEQLNNRPNVSGGYGQAKLSAEQLKSWFDSYPTVVREKVDDIIDAFSNKDRNGNYIARNGDYIAIGSAGKSLADLVAAITSGELANYLTVEKTEDDTPVSLVNKLEKLIELISTNSGNAIKYLSVKPRVPGSTEYIFNVQLYNDKGWSLPVEDFVRPDSITEGKIADGAVTTDKILDKAVTESKLAEDVQGKLNAPIKKIDYNITSGDLEITYNNGGTTTLPLPLERLVKSGELVGEDIVLKFDDPNIESLKIPVGTLLTSVSADIETLKGNDIYGITIEEGFNDGDKVLAINKNNGGFVGISLDTLVPRSSITESKLSEDVRAELVTSVSASTFDRYFTIKFAKGNAIKIPLSNFIPTQSIGTDELKGFAVKTNNIAKEAVTKAKLAPDVISDLNTISKHERRIEQLEGLTLKTVEDSTEAHEKVVPVGVGKHAVINKVGGKSGTRLANNNLCSGDGVYTYDDESHTQTIYLGFYEAGEYFMSFDDSTLQNCGDHYFHNQNYSFAENASMGGLGGFNFTLDNSAELWLDLTPYAEMGDEGLLTGTLKNIMICKADDADKTYKPYTAETIVTKPKSIESCGANLFDGSIIATGTYSGVTVEYDKTAQTFTLNGTATSGVLIASTIINFKGKKGDNYTVKSEVVGGSVSGGNPVAFFGASDTPNASTNWLNASIVKSSSNTNTLTYDYITKFWFYAVQDVVFDNLKVKVMLAQTSDTTIPYKPFRAEPIDTYTIPEAIRNREGYGLSGSYIDFDKRVWVDADGKEHPVSDVLQYDDDFLSIEVEQGGTLKFVNEEGTEEAVPSTVTYITKV